MCPWVPAVEYFGTQGLFHDYNVRADEPLKRTTANVWLGALNNLRAGKHDAQASIVKVAEAEQSDSPAMTYDEFVARLAKAADAAVAKRGTAITRGEAALLMWKSLR